MTFNELLMESVRMGLVIRMGVVVIVAVILLGRYFLIEILKAMFNK